MSEEELIPYSTKYYRENREKYKEYRKKESYKLAQKKYINNNKDKIKERGKKSSKNYYKITKADNPERILFNAAKARAKDQNLEFNLEPQDIVIPEYCPVLGIKLQISEGRFSDNSPSLDRVDNSKGYIKGNVKVVSFRVNALKKNGTIEEFEKILQYMKENIKMP